MFKSVIASLALVGLAASAMPEPVNAAGETRAKTRRAAETRQRTPTRQEASTSEGRQTRLRDRTTINRKDGRIDGDEFFKQVMERAPTGDN